MHVRQMIQNHAWRPAWSFEAEFTVDAGWDGYTARAVIPAGFIYTGAPVARVVFKGAFSATVAAISVAYIGEGAGGGSYSFASTPTQLFVRGSASFTIPQYGALIVTDPVLFAVKEDREHVVSYFMSGTSSLAVLSASAGASYYKIGNDASTVSATGYTGGYTDRSLGFAALEVR
jgi:hypothetical protein